MDAGKTDENGGVGKEAFEGKSNLFSDWPSKSRAKAGLFRSQGVQIETDKIDIIRGMTDTQISSCKMCKRKPSLCIDHRHNACIKERADKGRGMQLNWLDYGTVRWNSIQNVHVLLHMVWEGDIRAVLQKWTRVILHAQLFSDMILTNSVLSKIGPQWSMVQGETFSKEVHRNDAKDRCFSTQVHRLDENERVTDLRSNRFTETRRRVISWCASARWVVDRSNVLECFWSQGTKWKMETGNR